MAVQPLNLAKQAGTPLQFGSAASEFPILPADQQRNAWIVVAIGILAMIAVYWDSLSRIALEWERPQYSHGFLIPLFAAALLAMRRQPFREVPMWQRWIGVGLIAFGILVRLLGGYAVIFFADNLSFIPCVMGIFVIVGGLPSLRWSGPTVLFLLFMYPFPRIAEEKIMYPLQRLATVCSNFVLVTMGVDSVREGNVLNIANCPEPLNVAEQCSGLRMLTIFTALAVAMALLFTDRPWWERTLIVLSAIPIAIAVNVFRITLTGVLYSSFGGDELKNLIMHDWAGWIMMPLALGLLYLEIYLFSKIFVDVPLEAKTLDIPGVPTAKPSPSLKREMSP